MDSTDKVVEKTNLFLQYLENSVPALLDFGVKVVLSLLIYFIGVKKINKKLNEAKKELGY